MKISTWNVNSVRARLERLLAYLAARQPDALCLQETKCMDELFPRIELEAAGYVACHYGQKTYNGVAILAKRPLEDVALGLGDGAEDPQSRLIAATVGGVRIISVYAPNGQAVGAPAYEYKLEWYRRLRRYLDQRVAPSDRVVVCGDFNIAPDERDVYDLQVWENNVLFSPPERAALQNVCAFGLADTFRLHHEEGGRYSWWDYRNLSFPRNEGLRIDHVLASQPLAQRCVAADIDRDFRKGKQPSDHAPVWAEFDC